jgi:hypothetical protein
LTESELLNAVTEVIMMQMNKGDVSESINSFQLTQSFERRIGEEMILDKINKIFDEAARDREDFEASYVDLGRQ